MESGATLRRLQSAASWRGLTEKGWRMGLGVSI
jgi:hypothetical protein